MLKEKVLNYLKNSNKKYKNSNEFILSLASIFDANYNDVKMAVESLLTSGKIVESIGKYKRIEDTELIKGRLIGNNKGYAFVDVLDPNVPDFFIPPNKLGGAYNGDMVLIKPLGKTELSQEAEVVKVLERNNTTLVGSFTKLKNGDGIITADNNKFTKQIYVSKKCTLGAVSGQKVVVKVIFGKKDNVLNGEVIEILGEENSFKTLELSIIRSHKLYEDFPNEVLSEASHIPDSVSEKELERRLDLRDEMIFTIDGEDARDFDDAVSISKNGENYVLGVHIADVGHYVKYNTELDNEAYTRGTSAYFPNLVLPMLPKKLSNGICSLNEGVDRLALSCIMEISPSGVVKSHKICESVIKSKKRFTYTEVFAVIMGNKKACEEFKEFKPTILLMNELSKILEQVKKTNGMLDLDIPESQFILDENEKVKIVEAREHNEAHKLIENFMVLCNEVVAKHYALLNYPFIYRVHEKPTREKIESFNYFLSSLGVSTPEIKGDVQPEYVQNILKQLEGKPYEQICNKVLLRSLQKAKYLEDCLGHFGLALKHYCHFTSPIRRYPDLCIHRIIKEDLHGKVTRGRIEQLREFVSESAFRSSEREKNATEAERYVDDLYKAYYMQDHLGEELEGIISSVQSYGFYVELPNTIEGLVKIETLPQDAYMFYEKSYKLKGQGHCYSLGDKVKVKAVSANIYERKIEFVLC
ncbi:MAG: ribonuclease R [Clostridia bacterium]|nr:ribonuclease R [Clostridia bacterium]